MRTGKGIVATMAAIAMLVVACGGEAPTEAQPDATAGGTADATATGDEGDGAAAPEGGSVHVTLGSEPTTLDPQLRDDGGERAVNDNIYETLLTRDAEGALQPGLAAEMPEQIDDTTWQFKLREGISFHNGEPFNAESVVHSVERNLDEEFASEQVAYISTVSGAEAVDEYTVNILTNGPSPLLPTQMYWLKMVPIEASQSADFAENPVGTGPYRFVEWARGNQITIEANPDYWGEDPNDIDEVTYQFVAEGGTRLSSLIAGETDLITNLLPEDIERAPKAASIVGTEHPMFILNARGDAGVTADVRVRQALNYAVDKQAIAEELYLGHATVDSCQILSPSFAGYNDGLEAYPYDPERARELIAEAGAEGATVDLVGTAGRWLKDREYIEVTAGFLRQVGLEPNVQIFEFDEYLNRLFDLESRPDAVYVTSSNQLLDADKQLSSYYHPGGTGASNDSQEMAQLVDAARTETDPEARDELYAQATQLACDDAYFLFGVNIEDIYGLSERLEWQPRVDGKMLVHEMSLTG